MSNLYEVDCAIACSAFRDKLCYIDHIIKENGYIRFKEFHDLLNIIDEGLPSCIAGSDWITCGYTKEEAKFISLKTDPCSYASNELYIPEPINIENINCDNKKNGGINMSEKPIQITLNYKSENEVIDRFEEMLNITKKCNNFITIAQLCNLFNLEQDFYFHHYSPNFGWDLLTINTEFNYLPNVQKTDDSPIKGFTLYVTRPVEKEEDLKENSLNFDPVQNPSHYCDGRQYEPRKVIRDWGLNFNLGNAVKYLSRAGRKNDAVEDLEKAICYIEFELEALKDGEA